MSRLSLKKVKIIDNIQLEPPNPQFSDSQLEAAVQGMSSDIPIIDLLASPAARDGWMDVGDLPKLSALPGREKEAAAVKRQCEGLTEGLGAAVKKLKRPYSPISSPPQSQELEEQNEMLSPLNISFEEKHEETSFHINVECASASEMVVQFNSMFNVRNKTLDIQEEKECKRMSEIDNCVKKECKRMSEIENCVKKLLSEREILENNKIRRTKERELIKKVSDRLVF